MSATEEVNLSPESIEALAKSLRQQGSTLSQPRASSDKSSLKFGQKTKELEGAFGDLTGFVSRAGGSVSDFTGNVNRLAKEVPAIGGILGLFGDSVQGVVGYLDNTNATFQALSKVGAGFNGDLGALRSAAANTRMPLEAFADLVGKNSDSLAGLGTGVNNGAKRFAELSRAMFEDGQVIRGMMNLGYTIEQANEFLLDNANLLRRQQMLEGMGPDQVAQATLNMAENLAYMAEITGESADQQRQSLVDAQRDGRNIAALRRLEAQGLEGIQGGFDEAFAGLAPAGQQAQAFFQDMIQSGAPMSDLTKNFAAMNPQVAEQIRQMAAVLKSEEDAETKRIRLREQADRAVQVSASEYVSATNTAAASLGQVSGVGQTVADNLAQTENTRLGIEQMRAQMARERAEASGQKYTGGFGDVTEAEAARRFQAEARDRVGAQRGGEAEGQAISREINIATVALADSAAGINQEIGRNLSANTELQNSAAEGLKAISSIAIGAGEIGKGIVEGVTPGEVDPEIAELSPFTSLFKPLITTNALRTEIVNLPDILNGLGFNSDQVASALDKARVQRDGARALGGPVNTGRSYLVGEEGPETFVPGANGVILPNMQEEIASMQQVIENNIPKMQTAMQSESASMQQVIENNIPKMQTAMQSESASMQQAMGSIMPSMRSESVSMQSSMMQMANNLRSRLENMPENNTSNDLTNTIEELKSAINDDPAISTQRMEQLLDTLNQSMLQLVSINNNMSRTGNKTVDALRGASGNLLQGVRAR